MNEKSKSYASILPYANKIVTGSLLAVDPSTISAASFPGYALFHKGILKEYGTIELDHNLHKVQRLYEINRCLREDFKKPDVLAIEAIPPVKYGKGGMSNIAIMALQRSIGAILSAYDLKGAAEINTRFWMANHNWSEYQKGDAHDAAAIGFACISTARYILSKNKD